MFCFCFVLFCFFHAEIVTHGRYSLNNSQIHTVEHHPDTPDREWLERRKVSEYYLGILG